MNKNRRNIIIAVILLILLCVAPFWSNIKGAITGTDATSGATQETSQTQTQEETADPTD
jgi:ABC-type cobalt transport system substrate-binding protein